MLLQFCDKCGRPLSEGCLARGEAIERKGELICSACVAREQTAAVVQAAAQETGPLGHYEQAVWSCESCGIPVTALDLIEGRASRVGGMLKCSRCAPVAQAPRPAPAAAPAAPAPTPPRPAPARPAPTRPAVSAPRRMASAPKPSSAAAESYVVEATTEQKRPVLPIVMFAIILPMFAVSLYFAVSSQVRLNEVMGKQANEESPDRRNRRPQETLRPENAAPQVNNPAADEPQPGPQPEPPQPTSMSPAAPEPAPLPPEVVNDLVAIEKQLAAPVIEQLQSKDLAEVWQGLIEAGSRRLIACRPHVRALLRDPDDQTRAMACRVAALLEDSEALPRLKTMQEQDPSEVVRTEARKAGDRLTGQATREIRDLTEQELEEMLRDLQRELERRKGRSD
ncbi:MAG: HEAT repeat domain-containing protein [Planctomycetes bacterium]|nr:HEAT repeat domain-containing protein [Planctomycetota bacterium]